MSQEEPARHSDAEWRAKLTPEQYAVLREKGTEPPFTGRLLHNTAKGIYVCAGCGAELFSSDTKFDSGTGWPSFFAPAGPDAIAEAGDTSHGVRQTEVLCPRCGGHLGHVFDDGPTAMADGTPATGKRYCINSSALDFKRGT